MRIVVQKDDSKELVITRGTVSEFKCLLFSSILFLTLFGLSLWLRDYSLAFLWAAISFASGLSCQFPRRYIVDKTNRHIRFEFPLNEDANETFDLATITSVSLRIELERSRAGSSGRIYPFGLILTSGAFFEFDRTRSIKESRLWAEKISTSIGVELIEENRLKIREGSREDTSGRVKLR
ncbi:hypothetical protein BH10CYA1_BH10CYA1_40870 [soil metagenome]